MYAPKDKKELIVPIKLDLDSTFPFTCERGMACFNSCCKDAHIVLTPCDVIRMKSRLGLSSDEFLQLFTVPGLIPHTELPIPILKVMENREKACPFLGESGCGIYEDRPAACRYYPIGAGVFHNRDAAARERFFAMIKEPHCLGHELGTERTVGEWLEEQGIPPYDEVNSGWTELILKRKSLGPFVTIREKTLHMFFMGAYNVDGFRRFVFESRFLDVYVVAEATRKQIAEDDRAMLDFAIAWLKGTLYGEGKLQFREQEVAAQ